MANSKSRTEPLRIIHDGLRRFVWPCSVESCTNHCDPEGDVRLLCCEHLAMVPTSLVDAMDTAEDLTIYELLCAQAVDYAEAADEVING